MSKTHKDILNLFDATKQKKRERKASVRFKSEKKRRDDRKLYSFTTWIERTAQED